MVKTKEGFKISVYNDELTPDGILTGVTKIKKSFPGLPIEFFDVFADRIKENGFTDERLKDAVNNVIDNCVYPQPTIAQFISWNKHIKLYKHEQILNMLNEDKDAFKRYKPIKINGTQKPLFAHIIDIEQYKLTPFKNE